MQPTHNTATLAGPPTVPPVVDVASILRAAADYIDRHGWTSKALYEVYGPTATALTPCACLVGAIAMVAYGRPVDAPSTLTDDPQWPDFILALVWMDQFLDVRYEVTPYEFNDTAGRTAAEVVDELRLAAHAWDLIEGGAS